MALERCRETSTRPPNSFIIFRMFFSQFLKIPNILSYDVGKRSKISKFAWEAASDNFKNAFKLVALNAESYLHTIRAPSFITHDNNRNNRRTRNSSTSNGSLYRVNEPFPTVVPSNNLNFEIMTAVDFNKTSVNSQLEKNTIIPNESLYHVDMEFEGNLYNFVHPYIPNQPKGCYITPPNSPFGSFEEIQSQQLFHQPVPEPKQTKIKFDDTDEFLEFVAQFSKEDIISLRFKN